MHRIADYYISLISAHRRSFALWLTLSVLTGLTIGSGLSGLTADSSRSTSLPALVRTVMAQYFNNQLSADKLRQLIQKYPVPSGFQKPTGVFVTLSRQGKTRACWGSVFPQQPNAIAATAFATLGALTKEYRYPPISAAEQTTLKPQVTLIQHIESIPGLAGQNPLADGLMIRSGGKSGVILPGEATDAHYQLVLARLKAGIGPHDPYQLYRLKAKIYE